MMRCVCAGILLSLYGCASAPSHKSMEEDLAATIRAAEQEYQLRHMPVAEGLYRQVLAVDARFVPAYLRLGSIAYRRGDLDVAAEQFTRALHYDPKNQRAIYNLATIKLMQARALFERYVGDGDPRAPRRDEAKFVLQQLRELQEEE
jgi:tetratricopeptide (TPR) repeat protein